MLRIFRARRPCRNLAEVLADSPFSEVARFRPFSMDSCKIRCLNRNRNSQMRSVVRIVSTMSNDFVLLIDVYSMQVLSLRHVQSHCAKTAGFS